ncbi:MAG: 30S ribosomal protein THX [Bacteroidia bacterium]|nr:30S ribosomal protein THX [Bacteroidia bacterium]
MGKGDQKTKRGKIAIGSFGRLRPRKKAKPVSTIKKETTAKAAPKKAAAKKAAKKAEK